MSILVSTQDELELWDGYTQDSFAAGCEFTLAGIRQPESQHTPICAPMRFC